ncbi:hypothetical protein RDI58_010823 [Solanum bulbocastanum]|uniref:Reverse transcriptase zinc-binding domain-containing protein n=1 Tax=Solanum bulbocastanum TaxID=147425 RepID=A0AAN8YGQ2_SOLBU
MHLNKAAILKLLWNIDRMKDCLWVQRIHSYYIKAGDMYLVRISMNASWVVRKVLEAREQLRIRSHSHGTISEQMQGIQLGRKFSIHKMYISLLPNHPKVAWKYLTKHPRIHPRHRFILWLAIQQRLVIVERLLKFGINVTPECVLCGLHMKHLHTYSSNVELSQIFVLTFNFDRPLAIFGLLFD